jgi:PhnB protein
MKPRVNPVPKGYHTATPCAIVHDAANALKFYEKAFGAKQRGCFKAPNGKVMHAEIMIGDSIIMLADEHPEMNARSARSFGGTPVSIHLYVKDVDALSRRAVKAGAKVRQPVADKFYGDRSGVLEDPFGLVWSIGTRKENVSLPELRKRMAAACK